MTSLEEENAALRDKIEQLQADIVGFEEANNDYVEQIEELLIEKEELEEENNELKAGGGNAEANDRVVQQLENEIAIMRDTHKDLRDDLSAKEIEVDQLQAQTKELTSDLAKMRKKADTTQSKFDALNKK